MPTTLHTTHLRKVGGSVMIPVPPALLDALNLNIGEPVGLAAHQGQLLIKPKPKPKYTLDELLAQCDPDAGMTEEDKLWVSSGPVGRELV